MRRTASWTVGQRIKNDLWLAVLRGAVGLFSRLPRRLAGAVGAGLGTLAFVVAGRLRRIAIANARRLAKGGRGGASSLARASFASLGRAALEVLSGLRRPAALQGAVRFPEVDRSRLDAAVASGRGVVFLSAHLGAWELLAWSLAARGYRATVLGRESYDPRLTRWIRRLRRERGVRPILRGTRGAQGGVRRMIRALRDGGLLGFLIDQDTRVPGVFVPFLGELAWTPSGPARIALRTGAEVVVGACIREGDGWRIRIRRLPVTRRGEHDAAENTARFSRAVESLVRTWPEQWVWMHERWRTRPSPASEEARHETQPTLPDPAQSLLEVPGRLD